MQTPQSTSSFHNHAKLPKNGKLRILQIYAKNVILDSRYIGFSKVVEEEWKKNNTRELLSNFLAPCILLFT